MAERQTLPYLRVEECYSVGTDLVLEPAGMQVARVLLVCGWKRVQDTSG